MEIEGHPRGQFLQIQCPPQPDVLAAPDGADDGAGCADGADDRGSPRLASNLGLNQSAAGRVNLYDHSALVLRASVKRTASPSVLKSTLEKCRPGLLGQRLGKLVRESSQGCSRFGFLGAMFANVLLEDAAAFSVAMK